MRFRGRRVVVDLEDEHVICILLRDCNVKLAATRLDADGAALPYSHAPSNKPGVDYIPFIFIATDEYDLASRLVVMPAVAALYFLKCSLARPLGK